MGKKITLPPNECANSGCISVELPPLGTFDSIHQFFLDNINKKSLSLYWDYIMTFPSH